MGTVEGSHISTSGGSSVGALLYYGTLSSNATEYTIPIKAGGKLTTKNWTSASIVYKMGGSPNTTGTAYWTTTNGSTHSEGSSWYTLSQQTVHFQRTHSDYTATIYASITTNGHTSTAKKTFTVSKRASYTVSYNANGGSGAPSAQTKWYGENLILSSTVPTRVNYEFKGWATSATGNVAVQPGGTYTGNAAITYYAIWELLGDVKIGSNSAIRCDSNGDYYEEGTYGKFDCTYILIGQGLNEGSITARYRETSGDTWTDIDITKITHGDHIKAEGTLNLPVNLSFMISNLLLDKSYSIELTVTDSYGNTAIASDYISQAYFTMDFLAGGKGIGIGTTASCDETVHPNGLLTCAMDVAFTSMAGELKMWAGNTIPNGWLLCDGSEVSKAKYPKLYEAIGDLWGVPASSSNFMLPNLAGNVPVGYNSDDTDFDTVGKMSGEKEHKLDVTEMPSHTHIQNAHTHAGLRSGSVSGTQVKGGADYCAKGTISGLGSNSAATNVIYTVNTTATNQNTGGSGAHNNLQPYAVIKYIICAI